MRRKRRSEKAKKAMLVVGASEREFLFFSQVRKDCRYTNMTVIDGSNKGDDIQSVIKYAAKNRREGRFDTTWVVFSLEDWNLEPRAVRELFDFAESRRVKLAWTNPALPLWLYLHATEPANQIKNNQWIIDTLNERVIKGYRDTAEYLLGDGLALHLRIFNLKNKALENARRYNVLVERETGLIATSFVDLFDEVDEYCGIADVTRNQKQIGK